MVLWADLRGRFAPEGESVAAKQEVFGVLSEAEAILGSSPSLSRQREVYASALGLRQGGAPAPKKARSAWGHFDLGKSYLRTGDLKLAAREFRLGLELRPQDFWLNCYDGLCAYRLKRFEEALSAFRAAVVLAPEAAECYFNRGLAYQALGRLDDALADYSRALRLHERFTVAALNRGVVYYRLGRNNDARADLNRALALAQGQTTRGIIHYNTALVELASGDREAGASHVRAALELGNPDAQDLHRRLRR
jgi:tetratricopeptide (TPR) repeat protein